MTPFLGVRTDLSNEAYHASEGVSKSMLWTLHGRSPAHLKFGQRKETEALYMGDIAHCAVLEPDRFDATYIAGPDAARGTKVWLAAAVAAPGKTLIKLEDYRVANRMRDVLHADSAFRSILAARPLIEASVYWIDEATGEVCRCRPDIAVPSVLVDMKAVADASGDRPIRHVQDYGYNWQATMYSDGWRAATGNTAPMLFIFIEKDEPHAYRMIELDGEFLDLGRRGYRSALDRYHQCRLRDTWPSFAPVIETVAPLPWFRKSFEATQLPME